MTIRLIADGREQCPEVGVLATGPVGNRPGVNCLARIQNDRGGWQLRAALIRSPSGGGLPPVAILTSSYLDLAQAAEQAQRRRCRDTAGGLP